MTELVMSDMLDRVVSGGLFWRLRLAIAGIEVTQGLQYYESADHLTDPADRGPNNGIRLVAGKPAWVRVYLWSMFGVSGVTGTLEVQRRDLGILWNPVTVLNPDLKKVYELTK